MTLQGYVSILEVGGNKQRTGSISKVPENSEIKNKCKNIIISISELCIVVLVAQSCLTLCDPMDCSPPGPLSMEFSR